MAQQNQMESMQNILHKINSEELQKTSPTIQTSDNNELSIYGSGTITPEATIRETEKILTAFPKIEPQMISLLRERFKANGFNDQRMTDAVNFVIDNYSGFDKLPAIGDFVKFDKRVKVYTYRELMEKYKDCYYMGSKQDPIFTEYERVDFYGEERFAKKEDVKRYSLPKWVKK